MDLETIRPDQTRPSDLVGSAIQRREDPHLINGDAEYTDDLQYGGEAHLAILGSQYGHATVASVDVSGAEAMDGVLDVYTQADLDEAGVDGTLATDTIEGGVIPEIPVLADGRVRYAGQPVAAVVAESRYLAHDALDRIDVDYERRDAVVDPVEALDDDAPTVHEDAPDNVVFQSDFGDPDATAEALADAENVVEMDIEINRVLPTAMEPRAAVARYDSASNQLEVEMSTQNAHTVRDHIADTLSHPAGKIRVRPPDVGGGFGGKLQPYAGHMLACFGAKRLDRPVKWVATRTEDCQTMNHSRHQLISARAAVTDDGDIRAVHADSTAPMGAYVLTGASHVPMSLGLMANGQYEIPNVHVDVTGVFTTTTPLAAYRGAGRPEATYFIERLVRTIADELDADPAELRRKNFIPPEAFPYETGLGHTFDSGEYEKTLDTLLAGVDYEAFRERQREARDEGRYLGLGLSCYVEACGAAPGFSETGVVEVHPSGSVVVKTGTNEIGTGHRTAYAQIAAAELGVDYEDVEVREGDTDDTITGGGTAGSRAMALGGSAIKQSAEEVREKASRIAAHVFEAPPADVAFDGDEGAFHVAGAPDQSVSIQEVARTAYGPGLPEDVDPGLEATSYFDPPNFTFPFGAHAVIVEVDPKSGEVDIERYYGVDDVGEQINPKIVEGQVHGGIVQGLGQALYEDAVFDDNGQLLTGSLQDYAVPKCIDVPDLETETTVTPSPNNPLGVKGVGEAGSIAAPPAIVNAVIDALRPFGVEDIDMPLTAERVWQAVNEAVTVEVAAEAE